MRCSNGSPPRAWGQSADGRRSSGGDRFTPTGVGTISRARRWSPSSAVHPHGRGDNRHVLRRFVWRRGSPPRAWGQFGCRLWGLPRRRFTPMGVGTITRRLADARRATVHPHGRGDNVRRSRTRVERRGSPPRAWGQSIVDAGEDRNLRFTPTGVGTISGALCALVRASVHPHGRGDNFSIMSRKFASVGSPPRAWGQSDSARRRAVRGRFTPTGVGTMLVPVQKTMRTAVHPHGRGDNARSRDAQLRLDGSPPRAWGQCLDEVHFAKNERFTPTGVGTILKV